MGNCSAFRKKKSRCLTNLLLMV